MATEYFKEGKEAFSAGLILAHNPYPLGTWEFYEWRSGFDTAEEDDFQSNLDIAYPPEQILDSPG